MSFIAPCLRFARSLVLRDRPVYVHYAVTHRCNLQCRTCRTWEKGDAASELPLERIRDLARSLARLGCMQVSLGGGEPALRPDLPEIVRAFLEEDIRVRVLTNGLGLKPALAERLLAAGLREISFSIDALDAATQEFIDGAAGTFAQRIDHLLALSEMLPARGMLPLVNTIVFPGNFRQLPRILEFAERIGFFVSFIPIHVPREGALDAAFYRGDTAWRFLPDQAEELREVYRRIIAARRAGAPVINSSAFLERSVEYLLTGRAAWPCRAGRLYLSVSPSGMIAPCHAFEGKWEYPAAGFENVYKTAEYRQELRRRAEGCMGCFRPCWVEPSLVMTDAPSFLEMVRAQWATRRRRPAVDSAAVRASLGLT